MAANALIKPGTRVVDDRGTPKGKPCFERTIELPSDATVKDLEEITQRHQREGREQGAVWFKLTQVLIGLYRLQGWDHKPAGAK